MGQMAGRRTEAESGKRDGAQKKKQRSEARRGGGPTTSRTSEENQSTVGFTESA